jgi:hypothetical protein
VNSSYVRAQRGPNDRRRKPSQHRRVGSGNHNVSTRVRRGIAAIVGLTCAIAASLAMRPTDPVRPTPSAAVAAALSGHPDVDVSVHATGIDGAMNLRMDPDGTLLLDAPGNALVYRLTPRDGGGADVWLVAREWQAAGRPVAHEALARDRDLEFVATRRDLRLVAYEAARELPMAPSALSLARRLERIRGLEAILAPDASIFVNDTASGVVYRISTRG